jgi:hypothetical protein
VITERRTGDRRRADCLYERRQLPDRRSRGAGAESVVDAQSAHKTGVFIIRAWLEPASTEPLRARIRLTNDISAGIERTLTVAQASAVTALVAAWLATIDAGQVSGSTT